MLIRYKDSHYNDNNRVIIINGNLHTPKGSFILRWCQSLAPRWHHQMETFSALLAICAGNSPVTGELPAQRPVTRSVDVFFDLRLTKRLSKQWWGWWFETPSCPLWRHRNAVYVCVTDTSTVLSSTYRHQCRVKICTQFPQTHIQVKMLSFVRLLSVYDQHYLGCFLICPVPVPNRYEWIYFKKH